MLPVHVKSEDSKEPLHCDRALLRKRLVKNFFFEMQSRFFCRQPPLPHPVPTSPWAALGG